MFRFGRREWYMCLALILVITLVYDLNWHGSLPEQPEFHALPAEQEEGQVIVPLAQCSSTSLINVLENDPCYSPEHRKDVRQCHCRSKLAIANQVTYEIPSPTRRLNRTTMERKALIAFIHVNKAGGSTIKRDVLFPTLISHRWDGAAFGTFKAWKGLGTEWVSPWQRQTPLLKSKNDIDSAEPLYFQCGRAVDNPATKNYKDLHQCPMRVVWGGMTMGLCDHFQGPCIYLIILRDPFKRAISNYNYVCIEGAENRKKWKPEWKKLGTCPVNMREYFDVGLGEPNFLLWRLTRGCDESCGVEVAIKNLLNPCMRFLLLEELEDGLQRLKSILGSPYIPAINKLLSSRGVVNKTPYHSRIQAQLKDQEMMDDIKSRLKNDIDIYNAAKAHYKRQWDMPLMSCNQYS